MVPRSWWLFHCGLTFQACGCHWKLKLNWYKEPQIELLAVAQGEGNRWSELYFFAIKYKNHTIFI